MKSVLEIIKATKWVSFVRFEDMKLWYTCGREVDDVGCEEFFEFPVPVEDTDGAVFRAFDEQPLFYMRWIRHEFEYQRLAAIAREEMITLGRAEQAAANNAFVEDYDRCGQCGAKNFHCRGTCLG